MRPSPVRIGVVGYGAIGRQHARVLRNLENVEVVGIADGHPAARADATAAGFDVFADIEQLIASGIEAAIVSVPTSEHETVALRLIDAGCALLVEKPLAKTTVAAQRIIDAARRRNLPLMVGYVERYNPAVEALRSFLMEGNVGELVTISTRRVGPLPPRITDVGVIIDSGVHDLDAVAFLTNEPLKLIAARGGSAILENRADYSMMLVSAGSCIAVLESNWVTPVKIREMWVTGTKGSCRVDYMRQELSFTPGRSLFAATESYRTMVEQYQLDTTMVLPVIRREPLARQDQAFVYGVRGAELPSPEIALESLRVAEEAVEQVELNSVALREPVSA